MKDMPELSSLQIKKKIFNNRLQNEPENLKKIISGVTRDISEISSLILTLSKSKQALTSASQNLSQMAKGNQENVEGLFGKIPDNIESVAELMVFDSDINVYEDANVIFSDLDNKFLDPRQRANKVVKGQKNKKG